MIVILNKTVQAHSYTTASLLFLLFALLETTTLHFLGMVLPFLGLEINVSPFVLS